MKRTNKFSFLFHFRTLVKYVAYKSTNNLHSLSSLCLTPSLLCMHVCYIYMLGSKM